MGNKVPVGSASNPDDQTPESGVFFSEDLQDELMATFKSKILQVEWEKHQKSMMNAAQQRLASEEKWQSEFRQKLQRWKERNDTIQTQLDQKLDDLRARYSDYSAEIRWDLQKMEDREKNINIQNLQKDDKLCRNIRSELAKCFQKVDDVRTCDVFVAAFERCSDKAALNSITNVK